MSAVDVAVDVAATNGVTKVRGARGQKQ